MLLRFRPRFRQPSLVSFADLKVWQPKKGNRHGGSRVPLPPVSNHWMTVSHPAARPSHLLVTTEAGRPQRGTPLPSVA